MTVISYNLIGRYGEIQSFKKGHGGQAVFKIENLRDGCSLHIGDRAYKSSDVGFECDLSRLPDGDYTPRLITDKGCFELEGIRKFGRELLPLPTSEKTLRRLLFRMKTAEERIAMLEEQLEKISERIDTRLKF